MQGFRTVLSFKIYPYFEGLCIRKMLCPYFDLHFYFSHALSRMSLYWVSVKI